MVQILPMIFMGEIYQLRPLEEQKNYKDKTPTATISRKDDDAYLTN